MGVRMGQGGITILEPTYAHGHTHSVDATNIAIMVECIAPEQLAVSYVVVVMAMIVMMAMRMVVVMVLVVVVVVMVVVAMMRLVRVMVVVMV